MSSQALQRVAVRMLHDPVFAAAVFERPEEALAEVELTQLERGWLTGSERRAWGIDSGRCDRVFEALRLEYPVSCAVAEVASGGREGLLRFFGSPNFHEAVQERGSLVCAFGEWLAGEARDGRLGRRPVAALVTLEAACARVRRGPLPRTTAPCEVLPEHLGTVDSIEVLRLPEGTLALLEDVRRRLGAGTPIPRASLRAETHERVLVERGHTPGNELRLGTVPEGLALLLEVGQPPVPVERLIGLMASMEVDRDEAIEVLQGLVSDGLLSGG